MLAACSEDRFTDQDDIVVGSRMVDYFRSTLGADQLDGREGTDRMDYSFSAGRVKVYMDGRAGQWNDSEGDVLQNVENVVGSHFNDIIYGNDDDNQIDAGKGDDLISGGKGADDIDGGEGIDTIDFTGGVEAVDVNLELGRGLLGEAAGDSYKNVENIKATAFDDKLIGDRYDNMIEGGKGGDHIDGMDGDDVVSYKSSSGGIEVSLKGGLAKGGDAEKDLLINIEGVYGSHYDDKLTGDHKNNKLYGNNGNDIIEGGAGADYLDGGAGIDLLSFEHASSGIKMNLKTKSGSAGDAAGDEYHNFENILGSEYHDELIGDDQNNIITGLGGGDRIIGGGGVDLIDYSDSSAVNISFRTGVGKYGDAQGDSFSQVENAILSEYGDFFEGDANANHVVASGGNDHLIGGGGADVLDGGEGTDLIDFSKASSAIEVDLFNKQGLKGEAKGDRYISIENVIGSNFDDKIIGDTKDNLIEGGKGADYIDGGAGDDWVNYKNSSAGVNVNLKSGVSVGGDATGDILTNIENIEGSNRDDVLIGNDDSNRLIGNAGNDTLRGGVGGDYYDGGSGIDAIDYQFSSAAIRVNLSLASATGGDATGDVYIGIENVTASGHNDHLSGDNSANRLLGLNGDDEVIGLGGADYLDGGEGFDTTSYEASASSVRIDLFNHLGQNGDAEGDALYNIEKVLASVFNDYVYGDNEANHLFGLNGDDFIEGGVGADVLRGGNGTDTIGYTRSTEFVNVSLRTSTAQNGDAEGDQFFHFENVRGSDHNDILEGDDQDNTLWGGEGDDRLIGSLGNDLIYGGAGLDVVDYRHSEHRLIINLKNSDLNGGYADGDQIFDIEGVAGSALNDDLTGDDGANKLEGNDGDDILAGLAGADEIDGGDGFDTLDYRASTGSVSVSLGTNIVSGGHAQGDVISNIEKVVGSNFDDYITANEAGSHLHGERGEDTLLGAGGDDHIEGGADEDLLTGGGGHDYINGGDADDIIKGNDGDDTLIGGAGNDSLKGSSGVDQLNGGIGTDSIDGGSGRDKVIISDQVGFDITILKDSGKIQLSYTSNGEVSVDELKAVELFQHETAGVIGAELDFAAIWTDLDAGEQAKFGDDPNDYASWLTTSYGYELA